MPSRQILSIGQCAADHFRLAQTFKEHFAADVVGADNDVEAQQVLEQGKFDLILVNRVLDATGVSGLKVLSALRKEPASQAIPIMLVSNYPEAQMEAVELGAHRGFGKAALGQPAMLATVRLVLEMPLTN
ncbi:MAG TPA: response regulator [Gemmataceae bacterium]|nr:response regulator [Gemmataceae bacterium]